jgi:hypothetical protein
VHFANRISRDCYSWLINSISKQPEKNLSDDSVKRENRGLVGVVVRAEGLPPHGSSALLTCLVAMICFVFVMVGQTSRAHAQCSSVSGPSLCLHKTNGGIFEETPGAGDNRYYVDWYVRLVNNGNQTIEMSEWTDDFMGINPTGVTVDTSMSSITNLAVTGSPSPTPNTNTGWNGLTANEQVLTNFSANSMDGNPLNDTTYMTLGAGDEINATFRTHFQLSVTTVWNQTDAAARWNNGGSFEAVPITIQVEAAGVLPNAQKVMEVHKRVKEISFDQASGHHLSVMMFWFGTRVL